MSRPAEYGTLERVLEIYAGVWGAAADAEGADYWADNIDNNGWTYVDVADSFFDQMRVQEMYQDSEGEPLSGDDFLTALYQNVFKVETPDEEGFTYWQGRMSELGITDYNSEGVGTLAMEMIDGMWANEDTVDTTQMLYQNWITASVAFYQNQVDNDLTPFSELSEEDQATFLSAASDLVNGLDENSTQEDIDNAVDQATGEITPVTFTLEASADSAYEGESLTYTVTLDAPAEEATDVTFTLVAGDVAAADAGSSDTNLNDFAAGAFNPVTVTIAAGDSTASVNFGAILDGITELPEGYSVTAAVEGISATQTVSSTVLDGGVEGGETYTLTTGIDTVPGTAGNDLIIAGVTGAGDQTLNPGDTVAGGAGTDRMNIFGDDNAAQFGASPVSGVEQVYVQFDGGAATTSAIDVSGNADVEQIWVSKGTIDGAPATVTLLKAQTAGITGKVAADTVTDDLEFAFDDDSAAANDEATLAVSDADLESAATAPDDLIISDIETLNIVATGANKLGTVATDSVDELVVSGSGSVQMEDDGAGSSLKTINASANTGGVDIDIDSLATVTQDHTITGGSGDDTITTLFTQLSSADTVDLGAGDDALIFSDAATVTTANQEAQFDNVSNIEELGVIGTTLTVDADRVDANIDTFSIEGAGGTAVLTNVAEGTTLVARADSAASAFGASTIATKLGANTINVELEGSKTQVADFSAGLTITGSSTVNIETSGTAGAGANLLELTVDDNNTLNISGSQDLELITNNAGATTGLTIDGGDATGDLFLMGTANVDAITGGAGDDYLVGGELASGLGAAPNLTGVDTASAADTMTGGDGADTFGVSVVSIGTANMVTVTDFTVGDKLAFGLNANAGAFVAAAIDVSGAANLDAAIGLADNTATNVSWFNYDGNTYVVAAGATTNAITDDSIVKLSGVLDLSDSTLAQAATGDVLTFA